MNRCSDPQLCYVVNDIATRLLVSLELLGLIGVLLPFVYFDKRSGCYAGQIFCNTRRNNGLVNIDCCASNPEDFIPSICQIVLEMPIALFNSLLNV